MFEYNDEIKKLGLKVAESETVGDTLKNIQELEHALIKTQTAPVPNSKDPFYLKLLMSQLDLLMITSEILAVKDNSKKTKEFMGRFSKGISKEKELKTIVAVTSEINRVCKENFLEEKNE